MSKCMMTKILEGVGKIGFCLLLHIEDQRYQDGKISEIRVRLLVQLKDFSFQEKLTSIK
jgi:hypothetical protein